MPTDVEKAKAFIDRLLANPALQQQTPLQKEEQILQFLKVNGNQLFPTLSSPNFFPGKEWEEIQGILVSALYHYTNENLTIALEQILGERISYSFISFIHHPPAPAAQIKEDLMSVITHILQKPEGRRNLTGGYSAIQYRFIDRYINQVYNRKEYVYFELTKVQRLKMSKEEVKDLIRVSILLKPAIHLYTAGDKSERGMVRTNFVEQIFPSLNERLTSLPDLVIQSALHSNVSFNDNTTIEATSRIASVLSALGRNHQPGMKVDRGADLPEKSWLNIARRNYKYHGFDIKVLDEFYKIAAENGW
jgi:hypothetical protein